MLAQSAPKLLHIGFSTYSNERYKAIKLSSYKNQIYLLYLAKSIDIATLLVLKSLIAGNSFAQIGF